MTQETNEVTTIDNPVEEKVTKMPAPLIDRNSPCKCGSGKKYKKCCMNNEESHRNNMIKLASSHPELASKIISTPYSIYPWANPFYSGVGKYAKKRPEVAQTEAPATTKLSGNNVEDAEIIK